VDLQGRIFLSTDTSTLAAAWLTDYESNPVVDSVYRTLRHELESVITSAGAFDSPHQYDRLFYLAPGAAYTPQPALERDAYAEGIGVVLYRSFFASSPVDVEMRLLRYHLE
jgi:hypothetical protein